MMFKKQSPHPERGMLYKIFSQNILSGGKGMLRVFKEYPSDHNKGVSMLNVCLQNGEKRWVDRREASMLQRNRQIVFVEEIVTEDIDTLYNLYYCSIRNGALYDYSMPGKL